VQAFLEQHWPLFWFLALSFRQRFTPLKQVLERQVLERQVLERQVLERQVLERQQVLERRQALALVQLLQQRLVQQRLRQASQQRHRRQAAALLHRRITKFKTIISRLERGVPFQPFFFNIIVKKYRAAGFLILLLCLASSSFAAPSVGNDIDAALSSAETLFRAMKQKDYRKIWSLLTEKSRNVIVDDVYRAERPGGRADLTKQIITGDLSSGGPLSQSYWDGFLDNFNPDAVLFQSKWDVGKFEKNRGEIVIKHRKSEAPAILQMYKEQGLWRTGLVETFWARKPSS
jgi:hypothetical protein